MEIKIEDKLERKLKRVVGKSRDFFTTTSFVHLAVEKLIRGIMSHDLKNVAEWQRLSESLTPNLTKGNIMGTVLLKPDQTLEIIINPTRKPRDKGLGDYKTTYIIPYEDLTSLLFKRKGRRSHKQKSLGMAFSRSAVLMSRAVQNGVWTNGATIDRNSIALKLVTRFNLLPASEYKNISVCALKWLGALKSTDRVDGVLREKFEVIYAKILEEVKQA